MIQRTHTTLLGHWPNGIELTPREVLTVIAELNTRFNGKFDKVVQAMDETLDDLRED